MLFALRHERLRWSDVSPLSLFVCQTGEDASAILFDGRREDFDIGRSNRFARADFWALSIPFDFPALRLRTEDRVLLVPPRPAKFL
jgi:hypothetical protein